MASIKMHSLSNVDLSEFECPVCTEYFANNIFQCPSGHSLCEKCRKIVGKCPLCKEDIKNGRNYILERLVNLVKVKCHNESCLEELNLQEYKIHELKCMFAEIKCQVPHCDASVLRINLKSHIFLKHRDRIVKNGTILNSHQLGFAVVDFDEHLFWMRYLNGKKLCSWSVQHVYEFTNKIYLYEIYVNDNKGNHFTLKQKCQPCTMILDDVKNLKNYLCLFKELFTKCNVKVVVHMDKQN